MVAKSLPEAEADELDAHRALEQVDATTGVIKYGEKPGTGRISTKFNVSGKSLNICDTILSSQVVCKIGTKHEPVNRALYLVQVFSTLPESHIAY